MRNKFYYSLKPENILVDIDGYAKLTDFGLSKEGVCGNEARSMCGTAEYLSPEVLLSRQIQSNPGSLAGYGKAADWWSYGALIYEMLCGIPPFYSKDREQLYRNIRFGDPKLDHPYLSPNARDLLSKLLVKDPKYRLGNTQCGVSTLKDHPWFDSIDWSQMYRKELIPPYKPKLDTMTDTRHFPKEFTNMGVSP